MDAQSMMALREARVQDESLRTRFAAAVSEDDLTALAIEAGVDVAPDGPELSDQELEAVSGGYTYPRTDWVYCDNPWTNAYCTLKC